MASTEGYYPPLGFYYKVTFNVSPDTNDVAFQSVSGLSIDYEYESIKEGGENRFEHKLPVRTRYGDLTLKRGMVTNSAVIKWMLAAFRDRIFRPAEITIALLNEKGEAVKTWKIARAFPKKWSVSDLNAMENTLVIETLELTYQYFTVE